MLYLLQKLLLQLQRLEILNSFGGISINAFLLPYGLISAELGTTYIGDGGIYDWVTKAFGHRWGSRTSWYYWINFPLWLASLAVMTPGLLTTITGIEFSMFWTLLIELVFIG